MPARAAGAAAAALWRTKSMAEAEPAVKAEPMASPEAEADAATVRETETAAELGDVPEAEQEAEAEAVTRRANDDDPSAGIHVQDARDEGQAMAADKLREQRDKLRAMLGAADQREKDMAAAIHRVESENTKVQQKMVKMAKFRAERERQALVSGMDIVGLPDGSEADLSLENTHDDSEVFLHCLSFSPSNGCAPQALFFVVQFYHFPAVRTECAWLKTATGGVAGVLIRDLDGGAGIAVRFVMRNGAPCQNPRGFASYLATGCMHLEVWDAESVIQLGTARVPLACILRQGRVEVEHTLAVPIRANSTISGGSTSSSSQVQGMLHIRLGSALVTACDDGQPQIERAARSRYVGRPARQVVIMLPHDVPGSAAIRRSARLVKRVAEVPSRTRSAVEATTAGLQEGTVHLWRVKAAASTAQLLALEDSAVLSELGIYGTDCGAVEEYNRAAVSYYCGAIRLFVGRVLG